MDVKIEKRFDTEEELVLDVVVGADALDQIAEQAYGAVASQHGVEVHPGEDVRVACERVLSKPIAAELATNAIMNMAYPFARSQADDVVTVGEPLFTSRSELSMGEPFRFTARWALLPQFELSSYDPITITPPDRRASTEMVDEQIQRILMQWARYERTDEVRPVKSGDVVLLALRTLIDGELVEGLCFDERVYTTGIGAMPEDFERQIIGMVPGEEKRFTFEGVADYDANEQPIMGTYKAEAKLIALERQVLPELTDEWVALNMPDCKTVIGLRSSVRNALDAQLEGEYRHYLNYIAASELAKRFEGHIPDVAYEAMRDEIQAQFDREAASMNMTREQYMQAQGANEQQYSVRMVLQVRERLAQSIALDAYARHFGLEVEEADLQEFFKASAPAGAEDELRRQLEVSGRMYLAYEGARRLKANDHLVANATLV